jgi:hypothetical protein
MILKRHKKTQTPLTSTLTKEILHAKPTQTSRRRVSPSQMQASKLGRIEFKHFKAMHFLKICLKHNKPLNSKQQDILQRSVQKIKAEIESFWGVEHELLMEKETYRASSTRTKKSLTLLNELEEGIKTLERNGLVEKGFFAKAFFTKKTK